MLKKDYLLEMVASMSQAIGQIIFKKSEKKYEEAHAIANSALHELLGMPLEMVLTLPAESIFDFLSSFDTLEPQKALMLVDLLNEEGGVCAIEGDDQTALAIRLKCEELLNALDRFEWEDEVMAALDERMAVFSID